jgi:hypothetical protein
MSAQFTLEGTPPRSGTSTVSRATLRTRPCIQRALIRSWEYIPAVRVTVLILRMLAVLVLTVEAIALFSISSWWGVPLLVVAIAVLPVSLWVFTTAAKGWPVH